MKITDVEAIWLRVPGLSERCEWSEDALIVKIHTDSGIYGIGETDSSPAVVKSLIETPSSHESCQGLREILIGENPLEISRLWQEMYRKTAYVGRRGAAIHAISALDIALWDIAGKHYGVPVYELLGGKKRSRLRAYGTFIPGDLIKHSLAAARHLADRQFTCIKVGGGSFGATLEVDHALVGSIRQELGPSFELAVDVVGRWGNAQHAVAVLRSLEGFNLAWVEEPVPADDVSGYAALVSAMPNCKFSGGEALATLSEFEYFIQHGKPHIVQPDVTRCGGITEIARINSCAESLGVKMVPHGFSTGILLAATAHFLSATSFGDLIEVSDSHSPLATSLVLEGPMLQEGFISLSSEPGLGIHLDQALINKYRVDVTTSRPALETHL